MSRVATSSEPNGGTAESVEAPLARPRSIGEFALSATELGRGNFSIVFRARQLSSGRLFALKRVDRAHVNRLAHRHPSVRHEVLQEKHVGLLLRGASVAQLLATFHDESFLYYIYELVRGRELWQCLMTRLEPAALGGSALCPRVPQPLPPSRVAALGAALVAGLAYLHALGIAHRDLKPENIMLPGEVEEGEGAAVAAAAAGAPSPRAPPRPPLLKLIDFATSKDLLFPMHNSRGEFVGTADYMAPEAVDNSGAGGGVPSDSAADLWSAGAVIYHALVGVAPFRHRSQFMTLQSITRHGEDAARSPLDALLFPSGVPPAARRLVRELLVRPRAGRLGVVGRAPADAAARGRGGGGGSASLALAAVAPAAAADSAAAAAADAPPAADCIAAGARPAGWARLHLTAAPADAAQVATAAADSAASAASAAAASAAAQPRPRRPQAGGGGGGGVQRSEACAASTLPPDLPIIDYSVIARHAFFRASEAAVASASAARAERSGARPLDAAETSGAHAFDAIDAALTRAEACLAAALMGSEGAVAGAAEAEAEGGAPSSAAAEAEAEGGAPSSARAPPQLSAAAAAIAAGDAAILSATAAASLLALAGCGGSGGSEGGGWQSTLRDCLAQAPSLAAAASAAELAAAPLVSRPSPLVAHLLALRRRLHAPAALIRLASAALRDTSSLSGAHAAPRVQRLALAVGAARCLRLVAWDGAAAADDDGELASFGAAERGSPVSGGAKRSAPSLSLAPRRLGQHSPRDVIGWNLPPDSGAYATAAELAADGPWSAWHPRASAPPGRRSASAAGVGESAWECPAIGGISSEYLGGWRCLSPAEFSCQPHLLAPAPPLSQAAAAAAPAGTAAPPQPRFEPAGFYLALAAHPAMEVETDGEQSGAEAEGASAPRAAACDGLAPADRLRRFLAAAASLTPAPRALLLTGCLSQEYARWMRAASAGSTSEPDWALVRKQLRALLAIVGEATLAAAAAPPSAAGAPPVLLAGAECCDVFDAAFELEAHSAAAPAVGERLRAWSRCAGGWIAGTRLLLLQPADVADADADAALIAAPSADESSTARAAAGDSPAAVLHEEERWLHRAWLRDEAELGRSSAHHILGVLRCHPDEAASSRPPHLPAVQHWLSSHLAARAVIVPSRSAHCHLARSEGDPAIAGSTIAGAPREPSTPVDEDGESEKEGSLWIEIPSLASCSSSSAPCPLPPAAVSPRESASLHVVCVGVRGIRHLEVSCESAASTDRAMSASASRRIVGLLDELRL